MKTGMPAFVLLVLFVATGCGSPSEPSSNGNSGTGSGSGGPSCRTYATAYSTFVTTQGVTLDTTFPSTCSFDKSMSRLTCVAKISATGPDETATNVTVWRSTAEFVDEVQYNPPRGYALSMTSTVTGGSAPNTGFAITNAYDSQRRLTRTDTSLGGSTVYTAWDSKGRPTTGTVSGLSLTLVYDDTARTITKTQGTGPSATVTTTTYDTDGILVKEVVKDSFFTTTTERTIQTREQICK